MKIKTNLLTKIAILMVAFLVYMTQPADAQSRKRLKELENKEQDRAAEDASAEAAAKQRHLDIQSKQTRKEMKKYQKMSKRYNTNRREPFYKKWSRRSKR